MPKRLQCDPYDDNLLLCVVGDLLRLRLNPITFQMEPTASVSKQN